MNPICLENAKLLVVDDNIMNRDMLSRRLERKGYEVTIAEGGYQALEFLKNSDFDLVLLDVMMPDISGLDVLQQIRKHHSLIQLPVLMVTAKAQSEDIVLALELGANDYITKPIDFAIALARIQTLLSCKQMEQALKERESQLQDFFENANDLIQSVSPDGHFQYVNTSWLSTLGYTQDEVPYLTMFDIIHPNEHAHCMSLFQQVLAGQSVGRIDTVFVTKAGMVLDMEGHVNCRFEHGQPIATRGIFRNITERKNIERMKNEFVSVVSHELRTPLTSIAGSLGLLTGGIAGELPGTAQNLVEVAYRNCQRLVRLINDILDIDKIESGQMDFKQEILALKPLLEQSIEANLSYGKEYNITFVLQNVPAHICLYGDADRITQVMTNLLSNAAKFSPSGGIVQIGVEQQNGQIRIMVHDDGPGIPLKFQPRMFQKFSQADSSSTRPKGGSGLGLNISKAIVEKHGGKMGFETSPHQGTTFYFDLPEYQESGSSCS